MWTDVGDIFCTGVAYAVCSALGSDGPVNLGNVLWQAIWWIKPDDVSTSIMFRFVFSCLCKV